MSQGPLYPNLTKKVQKEVFQMANHGISACLAGLQAHTQGEAGGVWLGGLQAHTQGGIEGSGKGGLQAHTQGGG